MTEISAAGLSAGAAASLGSVGSPGSVSVELRQQQLKAGADGAAVRSRRARLVVSAMLAVDALAIVASYLVTWGWHVDPRAFAPGQAFATRTAILLTIPIWLCVFAAFELYDRRALSASSEEIRRVLRAISISVMTVVMASFWLQIPVSRERIIALWLTSIVSVGLARFAVRRAVHRLAARGIVATAAVVVGTNEEARTIARLLSGRRWLGYQVLGFVAVDAACCDTVDGRPVLGSLSDITAVVRRTGASAVIIAQSAIRPEVVADLDLALHPLDVDVRISPSLPHVSFSRLTVRPLDGLAFLALERRPLSEWQTAIKRAFDLVSASLLLVVLAPLMVIIAAAVRLGSRGPILFRQKRVGKDRRLFVMYKFRSMVVDAEQLLPAVQAGNEADGVLFKVHDDPRVTSVGRVLRRWGLDELPQLLNVIKGEMSLVGPRPALPSEMARYSEQLSNRLRVKPGLTGLWQVNGRHDLVFDDYVRYDLFYVHNWSLALDLYVLAKTIPAVLSRRGSY